MKHPILSRLTGLVMSRACCLLIAGLGLSGAALAQTPLPSAALQGKTQNQTQGNAQANTQANTQAIQQSPPQASAATDSQVQAYARGRYADVVAFFASDLAKAVTGQHLLVAFIAPVLQLVLVIFGAQYMLQLQLLLFIFTEKER